MEDAESTAIRLAAFGALQELQNTYGLTLKLSVIQEGFRVGSERVLFLSRARGIFKPKQLRKYPLSITTVSNGPYKDSVAPGDASFHYKYQGTDPQARDNRLLRTALHDQIPLIYFFSTMPGHYLPIWPVFVAAEDPSTLSFTVVGDDRLPIASGVNDVTDDIRRSYVTRLIRQRVHQQAFRDRVLSAYTERCCICQLRHPSLLDAAHIVADPDPEGEPIVRNGLALCKLHHSAYDRFFFGVRPDFKIEVKRSILDEEDGPVLEHGLKRIHGRTISTPSRLADRPEPWRLESRFEAFRESTDSQDGRLL